MRTGGSAILLFLAATAVSAAQVEVFSPQGEVKGVRQVAVRFSEPMVAFGDPRLPEPFTVDCAETGAGRWADQKNWIYDFGRDLPAGVRCSFRLKADLLSLNGDSIQGERDFEFSTGGPAIIESAPWEGSNIDEEQMFLLGLDAPASAESVSANAYCDIKGVSERVEVRVLSGADLKSVLDARRDFVLRHLRSLSDAARFDKLWRSGEAAGLPLMVLQCKRRLPNTAEVRLVWGSGIVSESGVTAGRERSLTFRVRDTFQARFSCERANRDAQCLPIMPMRLAFTAPVPRALAERIVLRAANRSYPPLLPDPLTGGGFVEELSFTGPFPERAQFTLELPAELTDDAGRRLANQKSFPLTVRTDEHPPLARFPARFGIVELKGDGMLPVTLRNLEALVEARIAQTGKQDDPDAELADKADLAINWLKKKLDESRADDAGTVPGTYSRVADGDLMAMLGWMKRMRELERDRWRYDEKAQQQVQEYQVGQASIFNERDRVRRIHVPKPQGARAFEVIGIPLKKPGFYVVELASPRLGAALLKIRNRPYYVQSAALVTNLAVHFKWGRESSLAWVTALDTGKPVVKAQVAIQDCAGKVYFRGATDAQGRARIPTALPERQRLPDCLAESDRQLVVSARLGEDLSFVMSEWNEGIARWRYNLRSGGWDGPYIATTVFDRTLLRAGETVHMKHYYRGHGIRGFGFVPVDKLPKTAVIRHQGSEEKYEVALKWDGRNSAESNWTIPEGAKKGVYAVLMTDTLDRRPDSRGTARNAGSFRVEEFRVPLMQAAISGPAAPQVKATAVDLDLQLRYLSGGGATGAPVKVRAVVRPKPVSFPDYEGFSFANGRVVEGIEQHGATQWFAEEFVEDDGEDGGAIALTPGSGPRPLRTLALALNDAGVARVSLDGLPASDRPQELNAELEYADPNGEALTTSTRVALWPSRLILGVRPDSWAAAQDQLKFQVLALDLDGKPVRNQAVKVQLYLRSPFSHRKRLVGGFYGYESGAEVKRLDSGCEGRSDERGRLFCTVKPPVSGNILFAAEARDRDGNPAYANASAWVAGKDAWWFDQSDDDRIDVIAERKRYEPGQTAQFQVRMPFREATALVTVEREGVIESFVQPLSGAAPVIKLPVKGSYAPNVFVSVLVVRGRVADLQPTALVDLGKPAFKMGVAEIAVGWRAHELGVKVSTDRSTYRVRDKARVTVQVTRRAGGKPPQSGEVMIAAVDEGLLELMPNDSWKLLQTMMRPRGIEVDTSTAAMQVVGKRHYGRKALPQGGGGGHQTARELFDTLLLWKGRVELDAKGLATVDIPLNDSLTSFRIIAVADSGNGLFGTGETSIRATQDLMLLSGLPPVVREADRFEARFTLRNASSRPMDVELNGKLEGQALPAARLRLGAGEARETGWEVTAPVNAAAASAAGVLRWDVSAAEIGAAEKPIADRLKVTQRLVAAVPVRIYQSTLSQLEAPVELAVQLPGGAIPGRGGLRVALAPTLAGEMPGVREYMSAYSYSCLEQRASRAVALRDLGLWNRTMEALPSFLDRDGFARYFSSERLGSDTLTAYLLAIGAEAGWDIPQSARGRMQNALRNFVTGKVSRDSPLPTADLTLRKLAALDALSRHQSLEPGWLDSFEIAPNLWPTSALLDWHGLLRRNPELPDRENRLAQAEQIVRSRLNFQGTAAGLSSMGFSTEHSDYLWWLMVSGDVNASRLLLGFMDAQSWGEDLPRIARGTLARQSRGHWDTTVANAWGVLALEKFSARFESAKVDGSTRVQLDEQHAAFDWSRKPEGGVFDLKWPVDNGKLALAHAGGGQPWVTLQSRAAMPLTAPLNSGFGIRRTVTLAEAGVPGELSPGQYNRGDVLRVRLELEARADMAWVVVDDPIPAGSALLGTGMARDAQVLAAGVQSGTQSRGNVWPAFEERGFDAFRAYFRFVPKGQWVVEYSVRLNNAGRFELPPTRVEAMYAPEIFGELPNDAVTVLP